MLRLLLNDFMKSAIRQYKLDRIYTYETALRIQINLTADFL